MLTIVLNVKIDSWMCLLIIFSGWADSCEKAWESNVRGDRSATVGLHWSIEEVVWYTQRQVWKEPWSEVDHQLISWLHIFNILFNLM